MNTTLGFAAALTFFVVLAIVWKLSRREKEKAWVQSAGCPKCGWSGQTSRYAGRCPRCNTPIGEQKGRGSTI